MNQYTQTGAPRLDAAESVWFQRELEFIDKQLYETVFPANKGRMLIPTQPGIPEWAAVYTWRTFTKYGRAKITSNMADDIPRADVSGEEESVIIQTIPSSYGWNILEIKAAAATGTRLDQMKAMAARMAIDTEIDEILANGSTEYNLDGLLTLSNTTSFTVSTKAAGGKTWAVATSDEISQDMFNVVGGIVAAMKGAGGPQFQEFSIVIPIAQYNLIAQRRMGDGSDKTILKFVLENSPYIKSIESWHHCSGAGAGSTDRMVAYPKTPLVLASIIPMEFTPMAPEQRNLEQVVNAMARTGGVIARYPVAVSYGDGI